MVVTQLALFNAHFWDKANNDAELRWLNSAVRQLEDTLGSILALSLTRKDLTKAGPLVPKRLFAPALHYAGNRKSAMHFLSKDARTLVHHDYHPGNLFWHHANPGFLDWQLVRVGEGIGDVAHFLATALRPEIRRSHEMQLLKQYNQILAEKGIEGLSINTLINRYRAHLIYPFEAMIDTRHDVDGE